MKKRIFTLSVVSLLALVATGCSSDVTHKIQNDEDVIVTIKNNGEEITYTANDLFDDYLSTTSGASAAFSAVYDVLLNVGVEGTQEMTNFVNSEVADLQNDAKQNAAVNGTTYKEELSSLLDSAGAEDINEFKQIKELSWKKDKFESDFYDQQMYNEKMNSETIEVTEDKYQLSKDFIENENPYHVRHILIKTSSNGTSFLPDSETLSEDEATKLGNTIKNLASDSSTFGRVAIDFSEDGSSEFFGGLNELMGRSTGYVNEFKFAVFQYDAYLNSLLQGEGVKSGAESLNIPETVEGVDETTQDVLTHAMNLIPYSVADALIDNARTTKGIDDENYKEGKEKYFPRNYLFNEYFSNRGLSFIFRGKNDVSDKSNHFQPNEQVNKLFADFFTANGYEGKEKDILCTEKGNPILVTRAGSASSGYQGIHFITIENSPLVNENRLVDGVYPEGVTYSSEEELKYYSVNVPKTTDDVSLDKRYVTFVDSKQKDYNDRANEIKNAIKNYDSNINFRLYKKLLKQLNSNDKYTIVINENIEKAINEYISSTENRTKRTDDTEYENIWKTYLRQLVTQAEFAGYNVDKNEIVENFTVTDNFKNIK